MCVCILRLHFMSVRYNLFYCWYISKNWYILGIIWQITFQIQIVSYVYPCGNIFRVILYASLFSFHH